MRLNILSWLFLIFLAIGSPVFSQSVVNHLKVVYGYDKWPGKSAPLLQAPSLESVPLQNLDFIEKEKGADGTIYQWRYASDFSIVRATVRTHDTINQAQMALLEVLGQFTILLPKAEDHNLNIGDIAFVKSNGDIIESMFIVKNNITIMVEWKITDHNNKSLFVSELNEIF